MKKITVIGLFCNGIEVSDGQSIKTRIVTEEIERSLGIQNVCRIDTYGWKKNPICLFIKSVFSVWHSENVLFLTDEGGIKVFPWLLRLANITGKCRLHYVVVGGWLPDSLKTRKFRTWILKKLDGVYVETATMKQALENAGLSNVVILPNCKHLNVLGEDELVFQNSEPYALCTFSRVMKEKGIAIAVEAVKAVNELSGRTVFTLDIYGQVDPRQTEWFAQLKAEFPEYVKYCGTVPYDQSVGVLKDYFALLFPTYFSGEGFAGTLIDAFSAGVPVIASKWRYNEEFVYEGINGSIIPPQDVTALTEKLIEISSAPGAWIAQRKNCLVQAKRYVPETALKDLISELKSKR